MIADPLLYKESGITLYCGNVLAVLSEMPASSVHCVVTSPPYWGLRDYDVAPLVWGGDPNHPHQWGASLPPRPRRGNKPGDLSTSSLTNPERQDSVQRASDSGRFCGCGSWLGHLGLEPVHDCLAWARGAPLCASCYVCHLVLIFREVRRVLREDGVIFLNLGDCYATGAGRVGEHPGGGEQGERWAGRGVHTAANSGKAAPRIAAVGPMTQPNRMPIAGLKPKDLVGVPWRVAFALQADGWTLRSDIVWAKGLSFCPEYSGSVMPESVVDRPTKSHEYLFLLAKSEQYFFDQEAVKEPLAPGSVLRILQDGFDAQRSANRVFSDPESLARIAATGRNLRSVWAISPTPYAGSHFAVFPPALVIPCIKAGTSERGCCAQCGAPWERVTQTESPSKWAADSDTRGFPDGRTSNVQSSKSLHRDSGGVYSTARECGWRPTCRCRGQRGRTVPATVLDPFAGSGTALHVAKELGRHAVGVELNPDYIRLAAARLRQDVLPLGLVTP